MQEIYKEEFNMEMEKLEIELEFLRYFYSEAGEYFGPADSEIYGCIREPEGY